MWVLAIMLLGVVGLQAQTLSPQKSWKCAPSAGLPLSVTLTRPSLSGWPPQYPSPRKSSGVEVAVGSSHSQTRLGSWVLWQADVSGDSRVQPSMDLVRIWHWIWCVSSCRESCRWETLSGFQSSETVATQIFGSSTISRLRDSFLRTPRKEKTSHRIPLFLFPSQRRFQK